jgi:hypothetical protein
MKTLLTSAAVLGIALMLIGPPRGSPVTLVDRSATAAGATANPVPDYFGPAAPVPEATLNEVVKFYCTTCHNPTTLRGNLSLTEFDIATIADNAVVGEKMVRKLRAGMMPPMPMPRPAPDTLLALVETIEKNLDRAAARPPIGNRPFQRLNRPEYEAAIQDLLALDIDAGDWLPLDTKDANFDNIAEAQLASTLLIESYLNAAGEISRMAVGDRNAAPFWKTYTQLDYVSQHPWDHVEGTPYGTRGGIAENHVFPADGLYYFEMAFSRGNTRTEEDVVLSIDGEKTALLPYEAGALPTAKAPDGRAPVGLRTEPIFVRAGQHHIAAAFVRKAEGPYEDLIRPHEWALAGGTGGTAAATHVPHLTQLIVGGPFETSGLSDSPSRQKVFSCRPTLPEEVRPCAQSIVERLAGEAFRRPATAEEMEGLLGFYDTGAQSGGFEGGVRMALEAILAHPSFYFRLERTPTNAREGQPYRVSDADLATRLAFFLWGATPDQELTDLAARGKLSDRKVLEEQTLRMLRDPRAEALSTRFAAQWLRLQDLIKVRADPNFFPNFDENLANAMRRETELFFNDLVVNDKSVMDLFSADYTFVNDRLARHYGFSNVSGDHFRKIQYPDDRRTGIFGQGSVLVLTSLAGRTSPVLRGKWVMEVLLGTPPPPPPPNVPTLAETPGVAAGKILTTRERMEQHRSAEMCRSCHMFMDPIGLALDNFDVTGKWRYREGGMPLDTRGMLFDGTEISTPRELSTALLKRPIPLARNFTENLLTYALGRRLDPSYGPLVRSIAREAEANDWKVSSFVLGVVKSDAFQMRDASVATQAQGNQN